MIKLIEYFKKAVDHLNGMRKLLFCLVIAGPLATILLVFHYIDGASWKDVAVAAIQGYCAGNVLEYAISSFKERIKLTKE